MGEEPIKFKKAQTWYCYVCGDFAGKSKEVIHLCEKKSCHRAMGIIEVDWKPTHNKEEISQ